MAERPGRWRRSLGCDTGAAAPDRGSRETKEETTKAIIERIGAQEARRKVGSKEALLVCAYDDEEKCRQMKLEGALSLSEFQSRASTLPKSTEVIFYCG